jgi:hypothetical protein
MEGTEAREGTDSQTLHHIIPYNRHRRRTLRWGKDGKKMGKKMESAGSHHELTAIIDAQVFGIFECH